MTMARVRTVFSGVAGTPWYSNLYFANDGSEDNSQNAHDATAAFWTSLADAITDQVTWEVLGEVTQIDEATGNLEGIVTLTPAFDNGEVTAEPLPWTTQALARLLTGQIVHNRLVRGRIFVPGETIGSNDDGKPTAGAIAGVQTAANLLITEAAGTLVVWSRPFAGTEKNPARVGSKHLVTTASVWDQWAVQRSRRD